MRKLQQLKLNKFKLHKQKQLNLRRRFKLRLLRPPSRLKVLKSLKKLETAHRQLEVTTEVVVVVLAVHAVVTDPVVIVVVEVVVINHVNQDQKVKVMIDPEEIVAVVETDQELLSQMQLQEKKSDQLLKLIVQNALKDVVVAEVTEVPTNSKANPVKMLTH